MPDGDIVFSYRPVTFTDTALPASTLLLASFIAFLMKSYVLSNFLLILALSVGLWLVLFLRDRINRKAEGRFIASLLAGRVTADVSSLGDGAAIVEKYYYRETVNDSATFGNRKYIVILSDERQLAYDVVRPLMRGKVLLLRISTHCRIG